MKKNEKNEDCQIPREENMNNVRYLMKKNEESNEEKMKIVRYLVKKNEKCQIPHEEKMKNQMKKKWRLSDTPWRKNEECQILHEEKMKNVRYLMKKKWRKQINHAPQSEAVGFS